MVAVSPRINLFQFACVGILSTLLPRPSVAQRVPPLDEALQITATGFLEQETDGASLRVQKTRWTLLPRTDALRKQIGRLVDKKVIVVGDLERADEGRGEPRIVLLAIRQAHFSVTILGNDDGTLRGVRVDDGKVLADVAALKTYLTLAQANELTIRYEESVSMDIVNEIHLLAHQLGGKFGTQKISLGKVVEKAPVETQTAPVQQGDSDNKKKFVIEDLAWLAGTWARDRPVGEVEESWNEPEGGLMLGTNRSIRGDKTDFEFLRIATVGNRVIYFASPSGRPPTPFELVESKENRAVFVNKKNDFPQRVIYELEGDLLHATVDGKIAGKQQEMQWWLDRQD